MCSCTAFGCNALFVNLNSSTNVKGYLEEYFAQSKRALRDNVDQNLYLLCIQCFEVYFLVCVCVSILRDVFILRML